MFRGGMQDGLAPAPTSGPAGALDMKHSESQHPMIFDQSLHDSGCPIHRGEKSRLNQHFVAQAVLFSVLTSDSNHDPSGIGELGGLLLLLYFS
jgi:hypothetical protein